MLPDGSLLMADTGDIEHGPNEVITVFKTPGTFTITPRLRKWLLEVSEALVALGYRSAAMDIEFMRNAGGDSHLACGVRRRRRQLHPSRLGIPH